jgi:DNA-binding MarR family transcriptional regulator
MPDTPSAHAVLSALAEAGPAGIRPPDLARQYTQPPTLNLRNTRINTVLHVFERNGHVRRGHLEYDVTDGRRRAYRWYITPGGLEYLNGGMKNGRTVRRMEREARIRAENAAYRQRVDEAADTAAEKYGPRTPPCERERAILRLRDAGVTLQEIGDIFCLSRERVRQIEKGMKPRQCYCAECSPYSVPAY